METPAAVAPDTLISTPSGLRRPDETSRGTTVEAEAVEITLRSGHRLVASAETPVLAAGANRLDRRPAAGLTTDDWVVIALRAGRWSTTPPALPASPHAGLRTPDRMSTDLAFLLGAFCAVGTSRQGETVLRNREDGVRRRLAAIQRTLFGVEPVLQVLPGRTTPELATRSPALQEWLNDLGLGGDRTERRVPPVVFRSTRAEIFAFLQGVSLGAGSSAKQGVSVHWRFDTVSRGVVDDLRALLTQLGVLTITEPSHTRTPWRLEARGQHGLALLRDVPFVEEQEAARLQRIQRPVNAGPYDVLPGTVKGELYNLLPIGQTGRHGEGTSVRKHFASLRPAAKSQHPTRYLIEKVAGIVGMDLLPRWIQRALNEHLYFLPVRSLESVGLTRLATVRHRRTPHGTVANGFVIESDPER